MVGRVWLVTRTSSAERELRRVRGACALAGDDVSVSASSAVGCVEDTGCGKIITS